MNVLNFSHLMTPEHQKEALKLILNPELIQFNPSLQDFILKILDFDNALKPTSFLKPKILNQYQYSLIRNNFKRFFLKMEPLQHSSNVLLQTLQDRLTKNLHHWNWNLSTQSWTSFYLNHSDPIQLSQNPLFLLLRYAQVNPSKSLFCENEKNSFAIDSDYHQTPLSWFRHRWIPIDSEAPSHFFLNFEDRTRWIQYHTQLLNVKNPKTEQPFIYNHQAVDQIRRDFFFLLLKITSLPENQESTVIELARWADQISQSFPPIHPYDVSLFSISNHPLFLLNHFNSQSTITTLHLWNIFLSHIKSNSFIMMNALTIPQYCSLLSHAMEHHNYETLSLLTDWSQIQSYFNRDVTYSQWREYFKKTVLDNLSNFYQKSISEDCLSIDRAWNWWSSTFPILFEDHMAHRQWIVDYWGSIGQSPELICRNGLSFSEQGKSQFKINWWLRYQSFFDYHALSNTLTDETPKHFTLSIPKKRL